MISYDGVYGGDEQGEPLDYFAYYDEGIIAKERREKEALEKAGGGGKGGGGGKERGGEGGEKSSVGGGKVGGKEGGGRKTAVETSAKNGDLKETSSGAAIQDTGTVMGTFFDAYFTCTCVHVNIVHVHVYM